MEREHAQRPPPTGRRRITVQELHAEAAAPHTFPPTSLRRVRSAFKAGAHALGLPDAVTRFALYLVGLTREVDWDGEGNAVPPTAWPSDEELRFRFNIGRSRCTELKRALLEFGLARMRRSPNGKRYGERCRTSGRILHAYGFDLSPLAGRAAEFERAAAELAARRAEGKRLRREITCLRNQVLALADLAVEQAAPGRAETEAGEWRAMTAQAHALWTERGDAWDPLLLVPIAARLKALALHARERAATTVMGVESVPTGPEYRPHLTATNSTLISKEITTEGRRRPDAHEDSGGRGRASRAGITARAARSAGREEKGQVEGQADALRGFPATPDFVLQVAPAFRGHVRRAAPDWPELIQAAFEVRGELGISRHAWGQACVVLGRKEATVALAAIAAKHERGQVASPGGYLREFVTAHQEGRLRLDRTLFGLAGGLRDGRPQPTPAIAREV